MPKRVCVFGSYKSLPGKKQSDILRLGRLLAERGFEVITGGFGGTMEDISKGAKEAGGKTIGVTYYKRSDIANKKANSYIDQEIVAKDIFHRIETMIRKSSAFIVLPGGTGTLLELAACLECVNKGIITPKPIIALGEFWKDVAERLSGEAVLSKEARSAFSASSCRDLITFVNTPEEAIEKIEP